MTTHDRDEEVAYVEPVKLVPLLESRCAAY